MRLGSPRIRGGEVMAIPAICPVCSAKLTPYRSADKWFCEECRQEWSSLELLNLSAAPPKEPKP